MMITIDRHRSSQIVISIMSSKVTYTLPVTDLRLYDWNTGSRQFVPNRSNMIVINNMIANTATTLLYVGLTREYKGMHWLQVNNIIPDTHPLWKT